jgi:hypothetical protein
MALLDVVCVVAGCDSETLNQLTSYGLRFILTLYLDIL